MKYKILIVDDEEMITDLISSHLQNCGYNTHIANNVNEAMEELRHQPNLIILDINMPGTNGLELCRNIRKHISCPIIFLTARITEQDKINGFQYGGDDYITKPFSLKELTARIEAHLRRDERNKNTFSIFTTPDGLIVNLSKQTISYGDKEITFSKKEFDLIEYLITNKGQVFDKEKIYETVWGYDAEGDSNVVKEHIRKIRNKFQEITGNDYIQTVWGVGYRWKN